jgi:hypothetical protein
LGSRAPPGHMFHNVSKSRTVSGHRNSLISAPITPCSRNPRVRPTFLSRVIAGLQFGFQGHKWSVCHKLLRISNKKLCHGVYGLLGYPSPLKSRGFNLGSLAPPGHMCHRVPRTSNGFGNLKFVNFRPDYPL